MQPAAAAEGGVVVSGNLDPAGMSRRQLLRAVEERGKTVNVVSVEAAEERRGGGEAARLLWRRVASGGRARMCRSSVRKQSRSAPASSPAARAALAVSASTTCRAQKSAACFGSLVCVCVFRG